MTDRYVDPDCRFARANSDHVCTRNNGQPLPYKGNCHLEARAQLVEARLPGPQYRRIDPAVERARQAHADCPSSAMEYGDAGARCTSCGCFWTLTAKGYELPPVVRMPARVAAGLFD